MLDRAACFNLQPAILCSCLILMLFCLFQVRADRIQSDIEELIKALTERCKKHGFDVKSAAIIELPVGISLTLA